MEKTIQIKGKNTCIAIEGDPKNAPIIFLHDIFTTKEIWYSTINNLKSKYYCIAVDFPGFGSSESPKIDDYYVRIQSQKIVFISDFLGLNNYSLAGLGMGGNVSIYIASAINAARIEKLILINSLPTGSYSTILKKYLKNFALFSKSNISYKVFKNVIDFRIKTNSSFLKHFIFETNNIQIKKEFQKLVNINPLNPFSINNAYYSIQSLDLTNNLRNIQAETLLIGGNNDQLVSIDQSYLCQTLIPNNKLAIIEKCGHYPMFEKPNNYYKALKMLLDA